MRIVHVVDYFMPKMGYQENLLAKWNAKEGHEVIVLTGDRYYPVKDYENTWYPILGQRICKPGVQKINNYEVIRLPVLFEVKHRPWLRGLRETIIKTKPDVIMVHGTGSFNLIRCALISKYLNIPCIADNHMIFHIIQKNVFAKLYYILNRLLLKNLIIDLVYKFIGVTNETCSYLEKYEKIPKEKIFHLPLGIDEEIFKYKKVNSYEKKIFVITQTGKMSDDKKPQWLADAAINLIKQKKLNLVLNYIGGGPKNIVKNIEKKFEKENLQKNLIIRDFVEVEKLPNVYYESDICVYPNGTSLSALEAAACGSLVIMADYPASKDRESKGIGITYRTGDIEHLASLIEKLLLNRDLREKIIDNSVKAIQKEYSYKEISKKFTTLCFEAINYKRSHL